MRYVSLWLDSVYSTITEHLSILTLWIILCQYRFSSIGLSLISVWNGSLKGYSQRSFTITAIVIQQRGYDFILTVILKKSFVFEFQLLICSQCFRVYGFKWCHPGSKKLWTRDFSKHPMNMLLRQPNRRPWRWPGGCLLCVDFLFSVVIYKLYRPVEWPVDNMLCLFSL